MPLYVEDELAALDGGARELEIEARVLGNVEPAPAHAGAGIGGIHPEQGGGDPAGGDHEPAAFQPQAPGIDVRRLVRALVGLVVHRGEGYRRKLTVARAVELDRQAPAIRVVSLAHGCLRPRLTLGLRWWQNRGNDEQGGRSASLARVSGRERQIPVQLQ